MQVSYDLLNRKLPKIFTNAIVVDLHFNIQVISQNLLEHFEFEMSELNGKNLNYLAGESDLVPLLRDALKWGHFNHIPVRLYSKSNRVMVVTLEGFHSGLTSDFYNYFVLLVKTIDDETPGSVATMNLSSELDHFIYRVAHDIRGPLATLQGLTNLLKLRDQDTDLDLIVDLLQSHARRLDERLFQMVYLSKTGHHDDHPTNVVDFKEIEKLLRKVLRENSVEEFVAFDFLSPGRKVMGVNELHVQTLLINVLLYFLFLPKTTLKSRISVEIEESGEVLKIVVFAEGFEIDDKLKRVIVQDDFVYTDIIHYPRLLHFYAGKKIAAKLHSLMKIEFLRGDIQTISIPIPVGHEHL
jgi:signal transduction histidine kinase